MLLSHERSVKKEDMDRAELDAFLRQITPREQFYLDNPGAPSPRFKTMEHRTVRGRDVLYFHLQELPNDEIHLRKDSRFTDVPYTPTSISITFMTGIAITSSTISPSLYTKAMSASLTWMWCAVN